MAAELALALLQYERVIGRGARSAQHQKIATAGAFYHPGEGFGNIFTATHQHHAASHRRHHVGFVTGALVDVIRLGGQRREQQQ